jgi:glycosyltransferase involved in cell wall biosynthesis
MVGVVSSSNPEMDRLAGELCLRGVLDVFVRRYVNKNRNWEKLLLALPGVKRRVSSTLGRRPLVPGLSPDKVVDAGVLYDFLSALSLRSGVGRLRLKSYAEMLRARNSAIARKGAQLLTTAHTVVANYGVAAPTFERLRARGGRRILNYPNAHHRYSSKLLAEEAEREPGFAPTITKETSQRAPLYDHECDLADTILVGSSFVRHSFVQEGLGAKDIRVIPYGSDTSLFYPDDACNDPHLFRALFVGQFTQRKGLSYLLRAYNTFRGPGTELAMAGKFVSDSAVFNPYRDSVTFLGNLSQRQLADVYRRANVFVFPTLLEGMPLVVLEAMASGLPVITTSHGPGDIVRDGVDGFIVPIRDSEAIVERLEFLRANPEARVAMGRSARARALEFTWKAYCEKAADVVLSTSYEAPEQSLGILQPENASGVLAASGHCGHATNIN